MSGLALGAYGLLMRLAQPVFRRKLAKRSLAEPGYGEAIEERFGFYAGAAQPAPGLVWLHAVSLGETRAAAILMQALREQHPGIRFLLTHGTATGRAAGRALLAPGDVQAWQPWDSPAAARRFFDHFKPRLGLLMETEVWPSIMNAAQRRNLPVVLVNARLSEQSLSKALRLPWLSRPAYGALAAVLAQTDADARRFDRLGARVAAIVGNLKFDAVLDAGQLALGHEWRKALQRPVVILASSREGEESEFFKQISALAQSNRAQLAIKNIASSQLDACRGAAALPHFLVVPRHPQRFDEVARIAAQHGLTLSKRSSWSDGGPAGGAEAMAANVWLGDSMGEMALYYALGSAALLGGSFAPFGGQNLMEAAACGCPVVMGPHTFNFADAAEMAEAAGAAVREVDMAAGLRRALEIAGGAVYDQMATAGRSLAEGRQGATLRTLQALQPYLQA